MKPIFSLTTIIAIAFALSTNFSCKDRCNDNCPDGADCIKAKCVCQSGRVSINGSCFYMGDEGYLAINSACYCYDTLAFVIGGTGEFRSIVMPFKSGSSVGSISQGIFYYELPDGDSIYFPELSIRCFAPDDTPLKPSIYGKKQTDGSWKIMLEFRNALTFAPYDTCTVVAKKIN
jgi:hypothetical protein